MALEDPRDKDTRGQRTSAGRTGPSGGSKGSGGGGALGGSKVPAGRQVYSSPIGPMSGTGDPMGSAGQHFSEQGTGFGGFLDKVFGYDNVGQRVGAFNNNPNRTGGSFNPFVAYVPNYPFATPGYVAASMLSAPMSPMGAMLAAPGIVSAIAQNKPYESMMQKAATALGASRGPRQGDIGVGTDRGGRGGALDTYRPVSQTPQGALTSPVPTTPLPNPNNPVGPGNGLQALQWPGQYNNIPGPTPYGYQSNPYNYWAR